MSSPTPQNLDKLPLGDRVRLASEVLGTYVKVRWAIRDGDAWRAVRHLRSSVGAPAPTLETGIELVAAWRLARIVTRVLRRLPSDSRCLFCSLTLMCMLERRGIAQTLVIAARPKPFAAHAWVEVDGQAILPDADPGFERLMEL
jgi:Transglutaminase-like superfamily